MNTIQPSRLSILTRPYQWRGNLRLGIGIYVLAKKVEKNWLLEPDQKLWAEVLSELDSEGLLDQVMPKANPEFLASGYAYTHAQTEKDTCVVKVEVGNLQKSLLVFGDRYWIDNKPSKPQEFSKLAINWKNAFGGSSNAKNTAGKGLDEIQVGELKVTPLPNIENPLQQISSRTDRPEPISFGPIGPNHPDRLAMIGSYSEEWFKYDFPGFLPDMDPRIFNMAADDQQWTQLGEVPKGASFKIWNMHPEKACWEGTLPRLRARAFITKSDGCFQEIDGVTLSTTWFLPERDSIILMFHGSIEIEDEDADDIATIMGAIEQEDDSRSIDHYRNVFMLRTDFESAPDYATDDSQLISEALIPLNDGMEDYSLDKSKLSIRIDKFLETQEKQTSETLNRYGIVDHDYESEFVGPDVELSSMTDAERSDYFKKIDVASDDQIKRIINQTKIESPQSAALLTQIEKMIDADADADNYKIPISGPPDLSYFDQDVNDRMRGHEDYQKFKEQTQRLKGYARKSYLYTAQHQQTAPRVSLEKNQLILQELTARYQETKDLTKLDLTGVNFDHLTFDGADFSETFLENTLFSHCILKNINFTEAVLTRSHFINCTLENISFKKSNLAESKFENCKVVDTHFIESEIDDIQFFKSTFLRSKFETIVPDKVEWINSRFQECSFDLSVLSDGIIKSSIFAKSNLSKVLFDNMKLWNTEFTQSLLKDCAFSETFCDSTSFTDSTLTNVMFEEDSRLIACKFLTSVLHECNFIETQMNSIQFFGSNLTGSDFTKAILHTCNFDKVVARDTIFYKTDLTGSSFRSANLIQATLEKSNLADCDFSNATMFRTNVSRVKLSPETKFDGTFQDQLEVYPMHRDQLNVNALFSNEKK